MHYTFIRVWLFIDNSLRCFIDWHWAWLSDVIFKYWRRMLDRVCEIKFARNISRHIRCRNGWSLVYAWWNRSIVGLLHFNRLSCGATSFFQNYEALINFFDTKMENHFQWFSSIDNKNSWISELKSERNVTELNSVAYRLWVALMK